MTRRRCAFAAFTLRPTAISPALVRWTGQQAVVTLPQRIDTSNADQIREQLLWLINRGAAVLITDLTGTVSCDYSGADALARAHHRAVALDAPSCGSAVTADAVRRVLTLNGFDRLVAIYPDLDAAAAAGTGRHEQRTRIAADAARTEEVLDGAVAGLFAVGLILQGAIDLPPGRHRAAHFRGPAPARRDCPGNP